MCPPAATPAAKGDIAASQHFGTPSPQTDVYLVNKSGALTAAFVVGGGSCFAPVALSGNNVFASGAPVAATQQAGVSVAQTDVFAINARNLRTITWVQGGGAWSGPLEIP